MQAFKAAFKEATLKEATTKFVSGLELKDMIAMMCENPILSAKMKEELQKMLVAHISTGCSAEEHSDDPIIKKVNNIAAQIAVTNVLSLFPDTTIIPQSKFMASAVPSKWADIDEIDEEKEAAEEAAEEDAAPVTRIKPSKPPSAILMPARHAAPSAKPLAKQEAKSAPSAKPPAKQDAKTSPSSLDVKIPPPKNSWASVVQKESPTYSDGFIKVQQKHHKPRAIPAPSGMTAGEYKIGGKLVFNGIRPTEEKVKIIGLIRSNVNLPANPMPARFVDKVDGRTNLKRTCTNTLFGWTITEGLKKLTCITQEVWSDGSPIGWDIVVIGKDKYYIAPGKSCLAVKVNYDNMCYDHYLFAEIPGGYDMELVSCKEAQDAVLSVLSGRYIDCVHARFDFERDDE